MSITDLPELVLDVIVEYLASLDLMNLSGTCSTFFKFRPGVEWLNGSKFLFRIPVLSRLTSIQMSFQSTDNGSFTKGQVGLKLSRRGIDIAYYGMGIADDRTLYGPQTWIKRDFNVTTGRVITRARRGDILKVIGYARGGPNHEFHVKEFKMTICFEEVKKTMGGNRRRYRAYVKYDKAMLVAGNNELMQHPIKTFWSDLPNQDNSWYWSDTGDVEFNYEGITQLPVTVNLPSQKYETAV